MCKYLSNTGAPSTHVDTGAKVHIVDAHTTLVTGGHAQRTLYAQEEQST